MLKIASAQYLLKAHQSIEDYFDHISFWVEEAVLSEADLLLFPEYGSIEIVSLMSKEIQKNLEKQLIEIQNYLDQFIDFYQHLASSNQVVIVAPSFPLRISESKIVNRAMIFTPDGNLMYQDKQMMTRFEDEDWKVSAPTKCDLLIFEVKGVKLGLSICFDIEFPDFSRNLCKRGAEIILAPSCTETTHGMHRVHIGAKARALENQCLVVVSQTVGEVDYSEAIDTNNGVAAFYGPSDRGFPEDGTLAFGEKNSSLWLYYHYNRDLFCHVRKNGAVLNFQKITQLPKIPSK